MGLAVLEHLKSSNKPTNVVREMRTNHLAPVQVVDIQYSHEVKGCFTLGTTTSSTTHTRKITGIARLILMGLGMSGLVCRRQSWPATHVPMDSHSVWLKQLMRANTSLTVAITRDTIHWRHYSYVSGWFIFIKLNAQYVLH